jgi:lipid-binding SYLF domain-containing protein
MKIKITGIVLTALLLPVVAFAQGQRDSEKGDRARLADGQQHSSFQMMIDDAAELYRKVVSGPQGEVPDSVLDNARCIALLPGVVTGAFVVGGTYGDGLASCKNENGTWSHPAAITLSKGSIGLQAGMKSADLVLFFQTEQAAQALKRGELTIGSDISAVAGKYGSELNTSGAGVVAYTHNRGLFAGASINGSKIGKNQSDLESYYGKKVDFTGVLEGRELSETTSSSRKLTSLFPAA